MMKLAIHGGKPVRKKIFPAYKVTGEEEKRAVNRVIDSGVLSNFLGCWHDHFYGGNEIRALEEEWADFFGVKHAIAVNSCTSGLYCAVGAVGTEPGEEIIVTPYTMSATATAPLIFNAVPVFGDIEEEYFCLDPKGIEPLITPRTRAVMVTDLFGLPYDADGINAIAKTHNLPVIEDCAQAPGATHKEKYAGTLADIGVYSLNYHKHIHCGEGGLVVTDNDKFAERIRLIRNHAEAVVEAKGVTNLTNMIGFNFRMTEIEAAIARCQLKKLPELLEKRIENVAYLEKKLCDIPAITSAKVRENCKHAYYVHCFTFNEKLAGLTREKFVEAIQWELPSFELRQDEGVKIGCGYVKPLYLQPLFQKKIAYGSKGCPFTAPWYEGNVNYSKGMCPVVERMYEKELITHEFMVASMSHHDLDDVVRAIEKVWEQRNSLNKGEY